ncbi:hypothetical protein KCU98_g890, partial [Aureobasidium melanogenum]
MSASSQPDAFAEAWKRSVRHKLDAGTGLDIPHPRKPPGVSIFATHELAHANKTYLTWKPEHMLWRVSGPDLPKMQQTLIDLMPEDNFEQLEKVYQYLYAVAELEEYHKVRLAEAITQLEEWKHVAKDARARPDALKKTGGDYVAVAWHDAILDKVQGRVILWADIVAQEQKGVRRQESKVDKLEASASEAMDLLKQRREPTLEQRSSTDVGWCVTVYLTARENAEIKC